jgi:hypothetical protein
MKDRGGEYRCVPKEWQEAINLVRSRYAIQKSKEVQKRRIAKNETNDEVDKPLKKRETSVRDRWVDK